VFRRKFNPHQNLPPVKKTTIGQPPVKPEPSPCRQPGGSFLAIPKKPFWLCTKLKVDVLGAISYWSLPTQMQNPE
jgi:hypothetical protein